MKAILTSFFLFTMFVGVNESIANDAIYGSDYSAKKCYFSERAKKYNGWSTSLTLLNEGKEFSLTMALPRGEPGTHTIAMTYTGTITQISENKFELYEEDGSLLGKLKNDPIKKRTVLEIIDIVSEGTLCSVKN